MDTIRILVVDDDPIFLLFLRDVLKDSGLRVVMAGNGHDALAETQLQPFDVIVTDFHMPGMSGIELIERVRAANPATEAILLTGELEDDLRERADEAGAVEVLHKPIEARDLLRSVRRVVDYAIHHSVHGA